jgi:hypothetical protein
LQLRWVQSVHSCMSSQPKSWVGRHPYLTGAAVVIVVIVLWLSVLVLQALTARPGPAGNYAQRIEATVAEHQKNLPGPDAWAEFTQSLQAVSETQRAAYERVGQPNGSAFPEAPVDWPAGPMYWPPDASMVGTPSSHPKVDAFYRDLLAAIRADGTLAKLESWVEPRRAVRPIPQGRMLDLLLPELGMARNLTRLNHARMMLALQAGDTPEFERAMSQSLAAARIVGSQATLIDHLVGIAIAAKVTGDVRELIAEGRLGVELLERIDREIARQLPVQPITLALQNEHLAALDTLEWTHTASGSPIMTELSSLQSETSGGAGGAAQLGGVANLLGIFMPSKADSARVFDTFYTMVQAEAVLPAHQRPRVLGSETYIDGISQRYVLVKILTPALAKALAASSRHGTDISAIRTMIALERFRKATGAYPAKLSELVPAYLPAILEDEFDASGLRYVLKDAKASAAAEGYTLYSVGPDLTDNGGNAGKPENPNTGAPGTDLSFALRPYVPPAEPAEPQPASTEAGK